nr:hypothetical protein [Gammaproteobacteria bacterium]
MPARRPRHAARSRSPRLRRRASAATARSRRRRRASPPQRVRRRSRRRAASTASRFAPRPRLRCAARHPEAARAAAAGATPPRRA